MAIVIGFGGARRGPAAALCENGRIEAACEEERVRRLKGLTLDGSYPEAALRTVLRSSRHADDAVTAYAVAEPQLSCPEGSALRRVDHHRAHAAAAFFTSPFSEAAVVVCDRHSTPEITCWRGQDGRLVPIDVPWEGPGLATLYSRLTRAFGFVPDREEHKLEALARLGRGSHMERARSLLACARNRLAVGADFEDRVASWVADVGWDDVEQMGEVARSLQSRLAEILVCFLGDVKRHTGSDHVCLGGGLFYNAALNTAVAASGLFDRTFVPADPGNSGHAVGAALAATEAAPSSRNLSPFLGPAYDQVEIKAVLDNCKLTYEFVEENRLIERVVDALAHGRLVGWFQGRMEWGPRALGNRTILASPRAPYVIENLNKFLKQRERFRSYAVSICEEDLPAFFDGPRTASFIEHEYRVPDEDLFRHVLEVGTKWQRVHTVGNEPPLFRRLLKAFGAASGVPALVNTSFNSFHEPIVCTPRDAVRVFYGSGIDMLVLDGFILQK